MKRVVVLAFEDRTRAGGGHARLLLLGLKRKPEKVRFDLRQIDAAEPAPVAPGRLAKGLEPVAARLTAEGLEITVGPEITERPDLTVGMAVEIVVRDLDVKGEFLWPDVAPQVRPKRRMLVAKAPVREPPPAKLAQPANFNGEATAAGATLTASVARGDAPAAPPVPGMVGSAKVAIAAAAAAAQPAFEARGPDGLRAPNERSTPPPPPPALELRPLPPPAAPATPGRFKPEPHPVPPIAASHAPLGRSRVGFAAVVIAAVLAIEAIAYLSLGGRWPAAFGRLANDATAGAATPAPPPTLTRRIPLAAAPSTELFDLLAPGQRSPSGVSAAGVGENRALALAAQHLQGTAGERDTREGAFWLQQYLAGRLADPLVARALTQLGSAHAEPTRGDPDYVKAHRLWQIAGAYGDPIALCFLATLHANGLGVPVDRAQSNRWQASAMAAGGCGTPDRQPVGADTTRKP